MGATVPVAASRAMASAAARLLRAYATQIEALRRLRSGGSQLVRVEHFMRTRADRLSSAPLLSTGHRARDEALRICWTQQERAGSKFTRKSPAERGR